MLTLRKEQVKVFGPINLRSFEERVMVHLKKVFQDRVTVMDGPTLLDSIRFGIQRARTYSIVSERDVCKYIDLSLVYGRDFDKDTALPWGRHHSSKAKTFAIRARSSTSSSARPRNTTSNQRRKDAPYLC